MGAAEKEVMLQKVANVKNLKDEEGTVKPATVYLKADDVNERHEELERVKRQKKVQDWVGLSSEGRRVLDVREKTIEKELRHGEPPDDVSGETKNALHGRLKELDEEIKEGMPPHEVMRRNPPGAVGWHQRWEKANKDRILERKNILRVLNPGNTDPDLSNVEMLRKYSTRPGDDSTFMPGAQIPGFMGYHNVPEENWNQTFGEPKVDTPLKQAERMEADGAKAAEAKLNRQMAAARAREAAKAKREAKDLEDVA